MLPPLKTLLRNASLRPEGENRISIALDEETDKGLGYAAAPGHKEAVEEAVAKRIGKKVEVAFRYGGAGQRPDAKEEEFGKGVQMEITIMGKEEA